MPDLSGFVAQKAFEITLKSDHITQEHTARLTHYHNTFEVMFLLASENIFFIKDTPLQTARGHMILIPPYTVHNIEYKIHTDYTRYVLYFEAAFFLQRSKLQAVTTRSTRCGAARSPFIR